MRFLLFAAGLVAIGGCSGPDSAEVQSTAEMANPASEFCVEQGGEVKIRITAEGQVGYCHLPDGTEIEEWEYFRANQPPAEG